MIKLVLAILACYRLAELVTTDLGPFNWFQSGRLWLGRRASESRGFYILAELLACSYCTGVWVAMALALYLGPDSLSDFVVFTLAIAGGQSVLVELFNED